MSSFSLWGSDAGGRVGRMDGGWRQVAGSPDESYHNSPGEAERGGMGDRGEGMGLESSGPLVPGSSPGLLVTVPFSRFWPQCHFSMMSPAGWFRQHVTSYIS